MTRKDYIKIAAALNSAVKRHQGSREMLSFNEHRLFTLIVNEMSDTLVRDNSAFRLGTFEAAVSAGVKNAGTFDDSLGGVVLNSYKNSQTYAGHADETIDSFPIMCSRCSRETSRPSAYDSSLCKACGILAAKKAS